MRSATAAVLLSVLVAARLPVAEAAFEDMSATTGLFWSHSTWGAGFADFDLDGNLDLYLGRHLFDPKIYWGDGAWGFDGSRDQPAWSEPPDRHGTLPVPLGPGEHPDLVVTHGAGEANELYRNDGSGVFIPVPAAGGIDDASGRFRAVSAADYDRDSLVDLWIGKAPSDSGPNSLFRGLGDYSFADVAEAAGLAESEGTVGGIWGDFDDDGDPDLLVGGEEFPRPTNLYRNDAGTFTDVSTIFVPPLPVVSGADWGDFDNDGDLDLAVCDGQSGVFDTYAEGDTVTFFFATSSGENGVDGLTVPSAADTLHAWLRLRGSFQYSKIFLGPSEIVPPPQSPLALTDEYVGAPTFTPGVDQGIWVWRQAAGGPWEIRCSTPFLNFDNFDGVLTDHSTVTGVVPHDFEDGGFVAGGPRVWRNDGASFAEITAELGLPDQMVNPRDISWVDWNNDGDLDLHVVDKGTSAASGPDALFRNDGSGFTDVTSAEGLTDPLGMGDGATWADVDGDGDLDVFVAAGAGPRTFWGGIRFSRNDGPAGSGLLIDLVGVESGVAALGTKLTARIGTKTLTRWRTANSWRGFADAPQIHFGLGASSQVDSLVIDWPSGTRNVYPGLPAGRYRLVEGQLSTHVRTDTPTPTRTWRIANVHPQPARDVQWLTVEAPVATALNVTVFDAAGRRVRSLHGGTVAPGMPPLRWDGRDDHGHPVASGVYWFRATDGCTVTTDRSVWIR